MNQSRFKVVLIVGLGNPGPRYKNSRHNIGFKVVTLLGDVLGVRLKGRRFTSRHTKVEFQGRKVILLRPLTFMNQSGKALRAVTDYYHIETDHILLVHDDLDLPLGRMKLVRNGGAGGHRGVLSVMEHLGSRAFHRLKIGIGRPRYGESIEDFVLNPFYSDEKSVVEEIIPFGVQACELFLSKGIDAAMRTINCQNLLNKEVKS